MKNRMLCAFIVVFIGSALPVFAQNRAAKLDSVLALLHEQEFFSGAFIIAGNDGIAYSRAIGDAPDGSPLTLQTPLPIASVTKPMTAAAVMLLARDGKVDYDASVTRYIPELPYEGVTVRQLLNHTGGVHLLTLINAEWDTTRILGNDELIALAAKHRPAPMFEPGTKYAYSNDGYTLLASMIERVSGQSYTAFLQSRLFDPLGMKQAHVYAASDDTATGWLQLLGADGVMASAEDLLAFDRALKPGRLFTSEELATAYSRPALADGGLGKVGFGWQVADGPELRVFHAGEGNVVKTGVQRYIDRGFTFILIQTAYGPYFYKVFGALAALWFGEPYELPARRVVASVDPSIYDTYVGVYNTPMFGRIHITTANGKLYLEPEGAGGSEELIPSSETTFYFDGQDLNWEFYKDENGALLGFGFMGKPNTMGPKVE